MRRLTVRGWGLVALVVIAASVAAAFFNPWTGFLS